MLKRDVLEVSRLDDSGGDEFARSLVHENEFLRKVVLGLIMWETFPLTGGQGVSVTDYRHCAETQDHRLEGSKTALPPPNILVADQYWWQITVPISAIYYPITSTFFVYI